MIERIYSEEKANQCDELLTKLIQDERQYDKSLDANFVVKDYFKNIVQNNENILLGYSDSAKIVGYIFAKPTLNDNQKGYLIDGLFVKKEHRKQGISKELIKEILKILSNQNIDYIEINVMFDNTIAKDIYEEFGFKGFKIQMRKEIKKN